MDTDSAPGSSNAPARDPSAEAELQPISGPPSDSVVDWKATTESVQRGRVLASAFDGLIRARKTTNLTTRTQAAQRVLEHWRAAPDTWIALHPTGLKIDAKTVLEQKLDERSWILPAFMAGLRGMRPRREATAQDLLRLTSELGELATNSSSLAAFHDWLWADGAEGLDIDLRHSFSEAMDLVANDEIIRQRLVAVRSEPMSPLDASSSAVTRRELDAAAARVEFDLPLEEYSKVLGATAAGADDTELRQELRQAFEDAATWARAEVDVTLAVKELREAIPPSRLAGQLLARISQGADHLVLRHLDELLTGSEDYAKALATQLASQGLGATLGRNARIEDPQLRAELAEFVKKCPAEISVELVRTLLARAGSDPATKSGVLDWIRLVGIRELLDFIEAETLDSESARMLAEPLSSGHLPISLIHALFTKLQPLPAVTLVGALPDSILWSLRGPLKALLHSESTQVVDRAVSILAAKSDARAAELMALVIDETDGRGFSAHALGMSCRLLVKLKQGEAHVLRWMRSRSATIPLRLAALHALQGDPKLRERVLERRTAELLDPRELRDALAQARRVVEKGKS